jgi:uncharacterized repeat protein (TIGR03803 family)
MLASASILTALSLAITSVNGGISIYTLPSSNNLDGTVPATSIVAGKLTRAPALLDLVNAHANLNTIHSFSGQLTGIGARRGGYLPGGGLVQSRDGVLYGVTARTAGQWDIGGGIYRITTNAGFTPLYEFTVDIAGLMLGTLEPGTILHTFTGTSDGHDPAAGLLLGKDGYFYGTTAGNLGTIFRVDTTGSLTTLYTFTGGNDGSKPLARLVQGQDGTFYGTAAIGGSGQGGTVFQLTFTELAPKRQILRTGNQIQLSWPAAAKDFLLEISHALDKRAPWSLAAGAPAPWGDQLIWTTPASAQKTFYRLRAK